MRAGPIGAYFADAAETKIVAEARASAEVTHAHPEGKAGAVAIALAAAHVARGGAAHTLFDFVLSHLGRGETSDGVRRAATLPTDVSIEEAASALGTGARVSAMDTVPFSLWNVVRAYDDFAQAMWSTVEGLGDRDTTCAIVGSIVGLRATVPSAWVGAREPLPDGFQAHTG